MTSSFIFDGLRTPFGRYAGALASVRPDELLAGAIEALLRRNPGAAELLGDIVIGCTNQSGEDARNVARNAALLAGAPVQTPAITVNRLCGSGLAAALDAARIIQVGDAELLLAGGVESMSRSPFVLAKPESAYDRNQALADSTLGWRFPNPRLLARIGDDSMAQTAENVATSFGITRTECDRFAFASQEKYERARAAGFFLGEIEPVQLPSSKPTSPPRIVTADEHPRPDTTLERISSLRPLSPGGVVTAANASGINDGAAALLLGSESAGRRLGLRPRARIVASAVAGVEPRMMGIGPVPAIQKILAKSNIDLAAVDVIEINEAFAAQVLGCLRQLGLEAGDPRLNPNGGAIAVGHPLGASGARLLLTAVRELERREGRFALVSLCIGIGQGIATLIERVSE